MLKIHFYSINYTYINNDINKHNFTESKSVNKLKNCQKYNYCIPSVQNYSLKTPIFKLHLSNKLYKFSTNLNYIPLINKKQLKGIKGRNLTLTKDIITKSVFVINIQNNTI